MGNQTRPHALQGEELEEHLNSLIHLLKEANRCADALAKMGANQNGEVVRMLVPPNEVIEEIYDLRGVAYGRGT